MNMAARSTVSFIVPVRDDARRLRRCLDSIARTLYQHDLVQVIVIDNGSHDDSLQVARRAGALVLSAAGRVAELRNIGARNATGDLLAFVDADHEIDPGWIRGAVHAMSNRAIAAVGAPYTLPPDANWVQRRYHAFRPRLSQPREVDWLGSGNLVVRRDAFATLGGFDASLETCEDVDFCNRLRGAGHRLVANPELRSVHFGDPSTLRALFFGELWRGRDNLRVTFRGPRTLRHFRSAIISMVNLAAMAGGVGALAFGLWRVAALCAAIPIALAALRALAMSRRDPHPGIASVVQSFAVAVTYDVARACALLAGGSHASRRSSEHPLDVTANSRS
jgi:glycosyltransferase involved in cell wall biosynthesis